ncbi:hypothetical protein E1I69_15420 [Bacillus timonensis]|uniref:O-antigen ligase domain-containing protein n=1 Tax=Bacillus timonensis TaxID=1033734 RepID=A0A4S3PP68_9BACI|nr:hypothetical protein [Bacillus timonensis]THE11349.1 hypothetical protein E1I69_15420 [Bacillus timonensis]
MNSKIIGNIKLWILALILATSTFSSYFRYISQSEYNFATIVMPVSYILFFLLAVVFFGSVQIELKKVWHSIFIFGIVILNFLFMLKFGLPKYYYMLAENLGNIQIVLISVIGVLIVSTKVISSALNRYYFIAFLFGLYYTLFFFLGVFERNQYLNENTWGLFLAPFLIYLFVTYEKITLRIIVLIVGSWLIYISGAKTTLVAFVTLPIFMFIFNKVKRPRLVYTGLLIVGFTFVYLAAVIKSELIIQLLTFRSLLWDVYIQNVTSSFSTIIGGTGIWKIENNNLGVWHIQGSGAHNTFISLFNYNGIIVLLLYVCFLLFSMRRCSKRFTVSDGVLYFAITFQFAETNSPLFSYIFPSVVFLVNALINNRTEQSEENIDT